MTATKATNARTHAEREEMLTNVQNAIRSEMRRAKVPERHREDVEQEVQMAVWRATETFDPNRGVKASTYLIGTIRNTIANWKTHHNDDNKGLFHQLDEAELNRQVAPESHEPESDDGTEDEQLDGETMGRLANALRNGLAEGVLSKLGKGHRRLVELVAFEGLTADQIAVQDGTPVKAIRTNLKLAIRKLCELGATQHAATDAEVNAVTGARNPKTQEQRESASLRQWDQGREDTKLRNALTAELAHEGAADALAAFGDEVKAVTLDLAAKNLEVSKAGTRLGLAGVRTRDLFGRVLAAVQTHVSGLVASELAQAATGETFRRDLNTLGPDEHAAVAAIVDGSLKVDDVVELLGGKRAAVVNRLRNVAAMGRNGASAAVTERGELIAR